MRKNDTLFLDRNRINMFLRDTNGKRFSVWLQDVEAFHSHDWSWFNDESYEILLVEWGRHCIYNALTDDPIVLEDLVSFFA